MSAENEQNINDEDLAAAAAGADSGTNAKSAKSNQHSPAHPQWPSIPTALEPLQCTGPQHRWALGLQCLATVCSHMAPG